MDEKSKNCQDVEPITQQPTKKKKENDQLEDQKQLILSKEQSPAMKTLLKKDQPAYSEDHSDTVKMLAVLTIDQPIYSEENPILSINQAIYSSEQPICSTEQPAISTDQPIHLTEKFAVFVDQSRVSTDQPIHSSEQPEFSKEQSVFPEDQSALPNKQIVLTIDQLITSTDQPLYSNEQPGYSKDQSDHLTQTALSIHQSVYSPDIPVYTPDPPFYLPEQSICSIDQPAFSEGKPQTNLSIVQPIHLTDQTGFMQEQPEEPAYSKHQPAAYSKAESAFTRKNTSFPPEEQIDLSTIRNDPAINVSSSSRELLITSKFEVASTKYVSVFPKNGVASLIRNSKNIDKYEISLCAAKMASVTSSYNFLNNGYFLSANAPLKINISTQSPSLSEPMTLLPVPRSIAVTIGTQPPSLFLQALSKLNESSLTLAVLSHFRLQSPSNSIRSYTFQSGDITPPDSLTNAPPTYSFVLRQIAIRRRPRFVGSFFASPSFVQHTPPPTYNGAFDLYIEPALPPPPTRHYSLGYNSMPVVCPECGFTGMTVIKARITICTHCCAFLLCVLCCWICAPLPYVLTSCKDVYHYCRNCRTFLGMYCPSNPDATNIYPTDCNR